MHPFITRKKSNRNLKKYKKKEIRIKKKTKQKEEWGWCYEIQDTKYKINQQSKRLI